MGKLRRFLGGATPAADWTLGLLMSVFYLCARPLDEWLLSQLGTGLYLASPLELSRHRLTATALRGYRSGRQSGVARACAYTAALTMVTATAMALQIYRWRSALSALPAGSIRPMVLVSDLDYWWYGLKAALLAALLLGAWIVRRDSSG